MRVECNVEIISQLEVGGGGTDWLEIGEPSLRFLQIYFSQHDGGLVTPHN